MRALAHIVIVADPRQVQDRSHQSGHEQDPFALGVQICVEFLNLGDVRIVDGEGVFEFVFHGDHLWVGWGGVGWGGVGVVRGVW